MSQISTVGLWRLLVEGGSHDTGVPTVSDGHSAAVTSVQTGGVNATCLLRAEAPEFIPRPGNDQITVDWNSCMFVLTDEDMQDHAPQLGLQPFYRRRELADTCIAEALPETASSSKVRMGPISDECTETTENYEPPHAAAEMCPGPVSSSAKVARSYDDIQIELLRVLQCVNACLNTVMAMDPIQDSWQSSSAPVQRQALQRDIKDIIHGFELLQHFLHQRRQEARPNIGGSLDNDLPEHAGGRACAKHPVSQDASQGAQLGSSEHATGLRREEAMICKKEAFKEFLLAVRQKRQQLGDTMNFNMKLIKRRAAKLIGLKVWQGIPEACKLQLQCVYESTGLLGEMPHHDAAGAVG